MVAFYTHLVRGGDSIAAERPSYERAPRIAYQPALDGVRALAVLAVLLFHGEVAGFGGGYLGVSVFFTLSGFLITSLLAAESAESGQIRFVAFYSRRARRLLPASLLLALLVVVAAAVTDWFEGVADLRSHVVGSVLHVANWVLLAGGGSYQDLLAQSSGAASPLEHYWSLAIEEQFYWLWPVAFAALWRVGRTPRGRMVLLGAVTAIFAIAAPVIAIVWGSDAAYWASPARAAEILVGALLALVVASRPVSQRLWILAPVALAVLAICVVTFPTVGGPAYAGWLPAIGVVSASLLLGLQVDSPVRAALSARPLVWLGKISYGIYLFHWPIFVVMNPDRMGFDGFGLLVLRLAVTLAIAQLSFVAFERPIRQWVPRRSRSMFALVGATTAVAAVAALIVVPSAGTDYWVVSDDVVEAAALDTDDEPLVVVAPVGSEPATSSAPDDETSTTDAATDEGDGPPERDGTVPANPSTDPSVGPTTSVPAIATSSDSIPELSRPVRIIVAGDSTAVAFGTGLVNWAAASQDLAQVEVFAAAGCGFVRGGEYHAGEWTKVADACSSWIERDLPERVSATGADVVVMITTVWDVLDHRWEDGPGFSTESEEMQARLLFDFTRTTEELLAGGAKKVVWVKAPTPDPFWLPRNDVQEEPGRHGALHAVMDEIAANHPDVVSVADLAAYFRQEGLESDEETRPDGIHVTPMAAEMIAADYLGERLVRTALDLD